MGFYKKNEYLKQAGNTRRAMAQIAMDGAKRVSQENNKVAEAIARGLNSVGKIASSHINEVQQEQRAMDNIRKGLKAIGAKQEIIDAVSAEGMDSKTAKDIVSLATNKDNYVKTSYNYGINVDEKNTLTGENKTYGDGTLAKSILQSKASGGSGGKKWWDYNNQTLLLKDKELANYALGNGYVVYDNGVFKTQDYDETNKAIAEFLANRNSANNPQQQSAPIDPKKLQKLSDDLKNNQAKTFYEVLSGKYKF